MEAEPLEKTISCYEDIATAYADTWFDDHLLAPLINNFSGLLPENSVVLDAGCGPGRDSLYMQSLELRVVGVDLATNMVEEARKRVPDGIFRRMDIRRLAYPSSCFDGVWACAVLNHLNHVQLLQALEELRRILKTDGVLSVSVECGDGERIDHLGRYYNYHSEAALRGIFHKLGLMVLQYFTSTSKKQTLRPDAERTWMHFLLKNTAAETFDAGESTADTCPLCPPGWFKLNQSAGLPGVESILWGNDSLYVFPDIAPLLAGHLLMTTTRHFPCFGACISSLQSEILKAQALVRQVLTTAFDQDVSFFEHGPARPKEAGACIDHAHWHCLPLSWPMKPVLDHLLGAGQTKTLRGLEQLYHSGQSYIFMQDNYRHIWLYPVEVIPHQYLRQVVATKFSIPKWRWQDSYKHHKSQNLYRMTLDKLIPIVDQLLLSHSP